MWVVAYTKVFAIRKRLDDRVNYITNGEKTSLAASITYIANPEKTEQFFFTSALNCGGVDTALSEMAETKQRFGKTGGVLGYHFIQSFAPGEVTPEQAHEIGKEFARRLFGDHFEVVIGTHLDKHHLHNHLVVNSVSCIDGHKYHSSPESYYNDVRGTSDELCRENALSIITPQGKGKHYAEWKAEQGGKPTVRGIIRTDIDAIIQQAYTTIQVEAAGYGTSSRTVTAERTYPNLSDADVSLIPKSVNENGRTLTLADVSWQEAAADPMDGYDIPIRYTAVASYTGTATSKYATGYTVTANYRGDVTRTSCDTVIYTAAFSSAGNEKGGIDFSWPWLLIPAGPWRWAAALCRVSGISPQHQ